MAGFIKKIQLLSDAIIGNLLKLKVNYDLYIRKSLSISDEVEPTLMVTLTSYGHRLRHSVQYTLYSILKQKVRPGKIVLWIDADEFCSEEIPAGLRVLQGYGVEIREYVPKIRSYRKFIPALEQFPGYHYITVDDDLYYSSNLVQTLWEAHKKQPKAVIALAVTPPTFAEGGNTVIPYKKWKHFVAPNKEFVYNPKTLMPIGFGGVLYPYGLFDEEVLKESVFMKLCPMADDLWFYIQGVRRDVSKFVPVGSKVKYYQTDLIRQKLNRDRLNDANRIQGQNDVQLENLLEYYDLDSNIFQQPT